MSVQKNKVKEKIELLSAEELRAVLKLKNEEAKKKFFEKRPQLKNFLDSKKIDISKLRAHSATLLGTGILTGSILFSTPSGVKALPAPNEAVEKLKNEQDKQKGEINKKEVLVETLNSVLPEKARPLERNEEKFIEQVFNQTVEVPARASLEGEHLNTTYGYIGYEQHLRRYPGDTLGQHETDTQIAGMAPGLGAWGYFAPSRDKLTPQLIETEKWYAVVQTLYLPDWNTRQPHLKNWYKYRKVLIVNTQNGNAVVAAIADSGPAAWTGKHFGGSPEVMGHLGGAKYRKGAVLVFFVDDPENKIPLGPVEY